MEKAAALARSRKHPLSPAAISRIESGERVPQLGTLIALADIYDVEFVIGKNGLRLHEEETA
jgi:transcriptional regulator with XRE-family HTH domain